MCLKLTVKKKKQNKAVDAKEKSEALCGFFFVWVNYGKKIDPWTLPALLTAK